MDGRQQGSSVREDWEFSKLVEPDSTWCCCRGPSSQARNHASIHDEHCSAPRAREQVHDVLGSESSRNGFGPMVDVRDAADEILYEGEHVKQRFPSCASGVKLRHCWCKKGDHRHVHGRFCTPPASRAKGVHRAHDEKEADCHEANELFPHREEHEERRIAAGNHEEDCNVIEIGHELLLCKSPAPPMKLRAHTVLYSPAYCEDARAQSGTLRPAGREHARADDWRQGKKDLMGDPT
mmetsp:Transcript_24744/g.72746  ORF Transcript_24744/g.72746 Transcript_24744/m.72746 type:complete len:237 (-) Transcript_24744:179-889(-)|eukprot:CAMPEP_0206038290 /NCGR_PEP_ID=MMETSP1466-20131121/4008_1 /ASSEMBLY_ACC=CAM_ASM_001126 /TAXON_ID=44452 /ORGANISM="Pavlova gyrans, Strain CCMP608" /LENGTH=236 /DNA_ID=CAMNT_0053412883 /DNA_START=117 /DNA_END=827 /DNA_ORIENTATION=-